MLLLFTIKELNDPQFVPTLKKSYIGGTKLIFDLMVSVLLWVYGAIPCDRGDVKHQLFIRLTAHVFLDVNHSVCVLLFLFRS